MNWNIDYILMRNPNLVINSRSIYIERVYNGEKMTNTEKSLAQRWAEHSVFIVCFPLWICFGTIDFHFFFFFFQRIQICWFLARISFFTHTFELIIIESNLFALRFIPYWTWAYFTVSNLVSRSVFFFLNTKHWFHLDTWNQTNFLNIFL